VGKGFILLGFSNPTRRVGKWVNEVAKVGKEGKMATIRKFPLVTGEFYHIFNKSIAEYKIFNKEGDFVRMKRLLFYYQWEENKIKFSKWKNMKEQNSFNNKLITEDNNSRIVDIIAYCIMPTHIHLILKQLKSKGISIFMSLISNSYAKYFNLKYKRKGPLWEREFQNVLVSSDEQLLHLSRYIHLNPTTAFLTKNPYDWRFSSYKEFLEEEHEEKICNFKDVLDINPKSYKEFVEDRISYQRDLAKIKSLILE